MPKGEKLRTHGKYKDPLYKRWKAMRWRCNIKNPNHHLYSDKGIMVCKEWNNYKNFEKWALLNGYDRSLTLDRIDGNKGYYPENCRWATYKEQANNICTNRYFQYKDKKLSINDICQMTGLKKSTIKGRIANHWTIEEIINSPYCRRVKIYGANCSNESL